LERRPNARDLDERAADLLAARERRLRFAREAAPVSWRYAAGDRTDRQSSAARQAFAEALPSYHVREALGDCKAFPNSGSRSDVPLDHATLKPESGVGDLCPRIASIP
jgi:hypothetical protein